MIFLPFNTLEIYDTETDAWYQGKAMPTGRYGLGSAVVGNKIYAIGGVAPSIGRLSTVEIYDIETNTWITGESLPKTLSNITSIAVGDKIYVIGGYDANGEANSVYIYSTSKSAWSIGSSLNSPLSFTASAVTNGKVYIFGGVGAGDRKKVQSLQVGNFEKKLAILLNIDETVQLSVSYNLADNINLTWSSTNEAVATVDKNGKVTAIGEGQADIYAQNADGTFKEFISVKVVPGTANAMRLAAHLKTGEKVKLHLFDDPSKVTWKSMDESIATVSAAGQVTAAKKGLAIIQGELEGQTYQIYVRVNG